MLASALALALAAAAGPGILTALPPVPVKLYGVTWERRFVPLGIVASGIETLEQALASEHVAARRMVVDIPTPEGSIRAVEIDESLLAPSEKQMLEDLVAAAINDARDKADQAAQQEMAKVTSALPLPPGMKLPF